MRILHVVLPVAGLAAGILLEKSIAARDTAPPAVSAGKLPALAAGKSPMTSTPSRSPALDLYSSIVACPEAHFEEMAAELLALPADSPRRLAALDLLMERWVASDSAAALLFAHTLRGDDRSQAFKSGLLRLGEDRFEETFAWMNANLPVATRQETQVWLFCGLAARAPSQALGEIERLGPGRLKEDALLTVVSRWAETDINATFDWFKSAPWTGKTMELYNRLMGTYIAKHPDDARAFISGLPDDDYWKGRYGQQLVTSLAARDPAAALEVTRGLGDPRRRDHAYTEVFEQWSATDPKAAFDGALQLASDSNLGDATKNNAARQAAFAMLLEDRSRVLENYDRLPPDIRNEIAGPLVSQWMSEDPAAALAWAGDFDRESPAYNLALAAAAAHQESWDPEAAIATAGRITYEDIQRDTLYSALQNLYRQDPHRAAEVAADSSRVNPEIKTAFDRWVTETGAAEMEFLSRGR